MVGDGQRKDHELDVQNVMQNFFNEMMWLKKWFGCLASALAYMHGQGIRHQDIKPSNIIHRTGDVYFTDFSSSSQFEIGQTTSTETPARISQMYGAPEVVQDGYSGRHGLATDIFSLGCVFLEMLTVIDGRTINDFHQHCLNQNKEHPKNQCGPGAEASRGILLYSRTSERIDEWFDSKSDKGHAMYTRCIKPMLAPSRESRPKANEALTLIRTSQPWQTLACPCQMSDEPSQLEHQTAEEEARFEGWV
jgi:serine/threonine protein kinase